MNELREEMAMCAHMRVNQKNVLLDGTESGRISDSWVCGDCGTLFIPEAANREQKAEIERLTKEVQSALSSLAELPRIIAEINQSHATELASLRASAGEKPEDAYKRGQEDMMKRVILPSFYGSYPPVPYVAPTLPGEEE